MPRVIHDWSAWQGDYHRFATLYEDRFVIGDNFRGDPHTENAGTCTLQNLLKGEFDNLIREYFGAVGREEMRFLARVELAWAEHPRDCRCQLFGEDDRTDPSMVQQLGLVEHIEHASVTGGFTTACRCRDCGRGWKVEVDPSYHWTLYGWSEIDRNG